MTDVYEKIKVKPHEEKTFALPQNTDDLTKIKGIGSGTAEKLNTKNIYTYQHLIELTPEKLSEAPGVSIAMARKFIEEAKNLLGEFQEQNSVNKQNQVIEKTTEIVKEEKENEVDNIETFEAANIIVEEELPQEKLQREEKTIETIQKQWFNDKFNRSRLTASYPPIIERSSKESKEKIEEYKEEIPEQFENNTTIEPFESEVPLPEGDAHREEYVVTPRYTELPEDTKITEVVGVPEALDVLEVPTRSRTPNLQEKLKNEIATLLKNLGYYAIPSTIEGLRPFFQNINFIGCKLVRVNDNMKLIFLVPIKLCNLEGRILIHEEKIDFKTYSKAQESELIHTVRQYVDELLKIKDSIFEDIVSVDNFRRFIQKYLQIRFTTKKSTKNKKLYFVSGQTQYKILIEPILLTKIPAKSMEKSILFPYQRKSNLHVIDKSNIARLLQFLEKKYQLIESHTKETNSIELYQNADAKFRSSLKMTSLPFLGYSVVLLAIYFSQLYFLLRLFNSIGFAVIGIYFFAIIYFYFKFSKIKKELKSEFKTPYYLQNAQFSETDLLCIKEKFTVEQMAQFSYECFGKDNDFKVLEQIEKDTIKENIVTRQQEREIPQLYELDSKPDYSFIKDKPKNEIKYSSFFEE